MDGFISDILGHHLRSLLKVFFFVVVVWEKGKLSLRYIELYEILDCVSKVAYRLALPLELEGVHLVFHVYMLKKYIPDPSYVIQPQKV